MHVAIGHVDVCRNALKTLLGIETHVIAGNLKNRHGRNALKTLLGIETNLLDCR